MNLLGWVGLTVAGTLITLWPTMLRTRIAPHAAVRLRRALPVLAASVLVAAGGAAAGLLLVAALGVLGYLAGLGMTASPFIHAARAKPPRSFATLSVLSAVCWWTGTLVWTLYALAASGDWTQMGRHFDTIVPYLAAGSPRRSCWARCPTWCPWRWAAGRARSARRPRPSTVEPPGG